MNFSIGALQMGLPVTHAPPEPPLLLQLVLSYLTWLPKADSQRRRPYYDGSGSGGYGREWNQPGGPSDDEDEGDYFGSGNGSGDTVFITPVTKTGEAEAGGALLLLWARSDPERRARGRCGPDVSASPTPLLCSNERKKSERSCSRRSNHCISLLIYSLFKRR